MAKFGWFKRSTSDLTNPTAWLLKILGGETSSGAKVTEESSLKFTGVRAAVDLRSTLLASMPVSVFKRTNSGREVLTQDPVYKLIAYSPNPYMNAFNFWELMNNYLDLWGNAYAVITWSSGKPIGLSPVHPSAVTPEATIDGVVYKISDSTDKGLKPVYFPKEMLHFRGLSTDGLKGKSPIRDAAEAIGLGLAAEKFGAELFNNKGILRGVLEMDGSLDEASRSAFAKAWSKNADHGTPLLEYGIKYKTLNIPPEDAQFLQSREFQLQDIARIYHIPPPLLGELSRSTFSNVENLDLQFVKYGLRPMVKRYEKELEIKLFPGDMTKGIAFDLNGLMRGDTATRADYYSKMISSRVLSPNEVRNFEGLNPYDGGDAYENPNTLTDKSNADEKGN